mgnify:CR=1 FL=1
MRKRGKDYPIKLENFEIKTLKENGVLIKNVPYITLDGTPRLPPIKIKVFPDNLMRDGSIVIRRDGGRIRPKRRGLFNDIYA